MPILDKISLFNLVGIAGFVGVAGGVMGLTHYHETRRKLTRLPFRMQALDILHNNQVAVKLLGEPIEIKDIDSGDKFNFASDTVGQLKIPMVGTQRSGNLCVIADRISKSSDHHHHYSQSKRSSSEWDVRRVELKLDGALHNKTFVLYKKESEADSQS